MTRGYCGRSGAENNVIAVQNEEGHHLLPNCVGLHWRERQSGFDVAPPISKHLL